jgi:hypothetical protein
MTMVNGTADNPQGTSITAPSSIADEFSSLQTQGDPGVACVVCV